VLWCGGDEVFAVEWRMLAGTLALQLSIQCKNEIEYIKSVEK